MDIPANNQLSAFEKIILSWHPKIDIKNVKIIELKDSMISYLYNWVICVCENKEQEESKCRALLARIAETRLLVEERIEESRK